jgi:DNA-binding NarL/FixJ family response regulator
VLADDHTGILNEIRQLLSPEFEIARVVFDGNALMEATAALRPDIVVSDLNMPGLNGIEAGRAILRQGLCNAVVLLTMYNDSFLIRGALRAGIRGYVLKVDAGEELGAALHVVLSGGRYLSREARAQWSEDDAEDQSSPRG